MTYQSRKEEAKRIKYLNDREKEMAEDREMQAFYKAWGWDICYWAVVNDMGEAIDTL